MNVGFTTTFLATFVQFLFAIRRLHGRRWCCIDVIDQLDVRVTRTSWPTLWCRQKKTGRPFVGAPLVHHHRRRHCIGPTIVRQLSFECWSHFPSGGKHLHRWFITIVVVIAFVPQLFGSFLLNGGAIFHQRETFAQLGLG